MSNINDIVDVAIAIEAPAIEESAYTNILLVVPIPTGEGVSVTLEGVAEITRAKDLLDFGFAESDVAYVAASVAFSQTPGPAKLYVTPTASNVETVLNAAVANPNWYGVCFAETLTAANLKKVADWCEANGKMFGYSFTANTPTQAITDYDRTWAIHSGNATDENGTAPAINAFAHIAFMAKCFNYDPGSETWAYKSLNGIYPSVLDETKVAALKAANCNYYIRVADRNITLDGKVGSGEWIDIIRLRDWLVSEIQSAVYGYIAANPKVPYTDAGITGIQNQIEGVLRRAQAMGGIDVDQFDDDGNVDRGYIVHVPRAASISKTDKRNRILKTIVFEARLTGAIHNVRIRGTLTY